MPRVIVNTVGKDDGDMRALIALCLWSTGMGCVLTSEEGHNVAKERPCLDTHLIVCLLRIQVDGEPGTCTTWGTTSALTHVHC